MTKGRCMKCKKDVEMASVQLAVNKRGAPVAKGKCPACGTKVYRILKKDSDEGRAALKKGGSRRSRKSGGSRHRSSRKSGGSRRSRRSHGSRRSRRSRSRK